MRLYWFKAIAKGGHLQRGMIGAPSSKELKAHLREMGLSLVTYSRRPSFHFSRQVSHRILLDFCFHLEQFENAGIPLKESLRTLHQEQSSPLFKSILLQITCDVEGGTLFSKALEKHPLVFDPVFVGLIAAGEKTGQFSEVLRHLFQHLTWKEEIQAQTLKVLRYPLIVSLVFLFVVYGLMMTLVPELVSFIKAFSKDLPFSTLFLIKVSNFLSNFFFYILASLGIIYFFIKIHPKGTFWENLILDNAPVIGAFRKKNKLTRICHVMAVLFENGIDILQALKTTRKSLKEGQLYNDLENVERLVREGIILSEAFHRVGIFPPIIIRMIKIGEQTSSLQKTLFHVKHFFDTSLKREADQMIGLIEPLMILTLGFVLGWVIYAVFLPLYDTLSVLEV